jgi:hypothetical protein
MQIQIPSIFGVRAKRKVSPSTFTVAPITPSRSPRLVKQWRSGYVVATTNQLIVFTVSPVLQEHRFDIPDVEQIITCSITNRIAVVSSRGVFVVEEDNVSLLATKLPTGYQKIIFSIDGEVLAVKFELQAIKLYSLLSKRDVFLLPVFSPVAIDSQAEHLAVTSQSGALIYYNTKTKQTSSLPSPIGVMQKIDFVPSGELIAYGAANRAGVFTLVQNQWQLIYKHEEFQPGLTLVASPGGKSWLAIAKNYYQMIRAAAWQTRLILNPEKKMKQGYIVGVTDNQEPEYYDIDQQTLAPLSGKRGHSRESGFFEPKLMSAIELDNCLQKAAYCKSERAQSGAARWQTSEEARFSLWKLDEPDTEEHHYDSHFSQWLGGFRTLSEIKVLNCWQEVICTYVQAGLLTKEDILSWHRLAHKAEDEATEKGLLVEENEFASSDQDRIYNGAFLRGLGLDKAISYQELLASGKQPRPGQVLFFVTYYPPEHLRVIKKGWYHEVTFSKFKTLEPFVDHVTMSNGGNQIQYDFGTYQNGPSPCYGNTTIEEVIARKMQGKRRYDGIRDHGFKVLRPQIWSTQATVCLVGTPTKLSQPPEFI